MVWNSAVQTFAPWHSALWHVLPKKHLSDYEVCLCVLQSLCVNTINAKMAEPVFKTQPMEPGDASVRTATQEHIVKQTSVRQLSLF